MKQSIALWAMACPRRLREHLAKAPEQVSRWEILRLGVAGLYLLSVVYFMVFMQMLSDLRWDRSAPKLIDLAFDYFPHYQNIHIADNLVLSSLLFMLVGNMALIGNWRDRVVFIRRLLWLLGTLYLFRAFTLIVTTAPSPLECVSPRYKSLKDMVMLGFKLVATVSRTCSDNIYSGHTVILMSSFLMWRIHSRHIAIIVYSFCHMLAGVSFIILTHLHYTIDVLIAIFFTYAMFSLYFYGLERAALYHYALVPYGQQRRSQPQRFSQRAALVFNKAFPSRDHESLIMAPTAASAATAHDPTLSPSVSLDITMDEKLGMSSSTQPDVTEADWKQLLVTPRVLNNGVPPLIGWMDGLDLRLDTPFPLNSASSSHYIPLAERHV
ncbi:hypothetical protein H4R35_002227 [Dimargaris xerosporica]|nr:hypothetical protein H4R35_002227 [Dimargaris xerosporica]